ncbi:unnamed protein product [Caenorhabditis nigoni]
MPIALLKFPTDLLRDVLKQCNPFELYCLSKCSKRAQKSVKLRGKTNWKISYWGWNPIEIYGDDCIYYFFCTRNPEDYFKTSQDTNKYMSVEIPKGEHVELFFYLLDTLAIRIVELGFNYGCFDIVWRIAEVLIERDMEIEKLFIRKVREEQNLPKFMSLISQIKITKAFECLPKFPLDFDYQLVKYPRYIHIGYSFGFDINRLLNCTCKRIKLGDSGLSNQDLNVFFREWKTAGTFPNLQWLEIESKNIDNLSAVGDRVPPITSIEIPQKQVSIRFDENDNIIIYDAVKIYKDDGTESWLKVELGDVPKLQFLVFDPSNTVVKEMVQNDDEEEYEDGASDDEETEDEDSDDEN